MSGKVHFYDALFALQIYKLANRIRFANIVLVFSLETLKVHQDYFNEYALTVGKSSNGINEFKNGVLALVEKSKMISTVPNPEHQKLKLTRVYKLHSTLLDTLHQLNSLFVNEINNEYSSFFSEK